MIAARRRSASDNVAASNWVPACFSKIASHSTENRSPGHSDSRAVRPSTLIAKSRDRLAACLAASSPVQRWNAATALLESETTAASKSARAFPIASAWCRLASAAPATSRSAHRRCRSSWRWRAAAAARQRQEERQRLWADREVAGAAEASRHHAEAIGKARADFEAAVVSDSSKAVAAFQRWTGELAAKHAANRSLDLAMSVLGRTARLSEWPGLRFSVECDAILEKHAGTQLDAATLSEADRRRAAITGQESTS